jgi:hypothetical protein
MLPLPCSTPASSASSRLTMVWKDASRLALCAINSGMSCAWKLLISPPSTDVPLVAALGDVDELVAQQVGRADSRHRVHGDFRQVTSCTCNSNSTVRLGSGELLSATLSTEPMVMPFSRTGVLSVMPEASSRKTCSVAVRWNGFLELVSRKISATESGTRSARPLRPSTATTVLWCCDPAWSIPAASRTSKCRDLSTLPARSWPPSKDQPAFPKHHESGPHGPPRPVTSRLQPPLFRIVAEIRHQIPVLIAVRHQQGGGLATSRSLMSSAMMVWAVMGSSPAVGES